MISCQYVGFKFDASQERASLRVSFESWIYSVALKGFICVWLMLSADLAALIVH
jgi:hypothetical protein